MKKNCQRLDSMLQRLMTEDVVGSPTPEDIRHSESCDECRAAIKNLQKIDSVFDRYYSEVRSVTPPFVFDMKAIKSPPKPQESGESFTSTLVRLINSLMTPKFVLTFACLSMIAVGIFRTTLRNVNVSDPEKVEVTSTGLELAMVSGTQAKIISPEGTFIPLSEKSASLASGSLIELADAGSIASIEFSSSGRVTLNGKGLVRIIPRGFSVSDGNFTADFASNSPGYTVEVPGAELLIRGTKISFQLVNGTGKLQLLEGSVAVKSQTSFSWKQNEILLLTSNGIMREEPDAIQTQPQPQPQTQPGETENIYKTPDYSDPSASSTVPSTINNSFPTNK
ncbi:MAG: hypothetical protein HQM10_09390 [Candidatus Riflebacteria bacterium]|nr:hypothetical protein [Candidatus Riflebacteria bacterium]